MNTSVRETIIWGGGAIGGVIACELARAGQQVTLVDIVEAHVARIRESGLELVAPDGSSRATAISACTPQELSGQYARIILCVKGQHTTAATQMLTPHLREDGWVLSMQNGLTEHRVAALAGASRTVGAHVNFAADYLEPGRIQYGGKGSMLIGAFAPDASRHAMDATALLSTAFQDVRLTDNLQGYKWSKVCLGAMLFVTAMSNETMAEQFENPALEPLWHALAAEVLRVADAAGVQPEPFDGFEPACLTATANPAQVRHALDGIAHHCRTAWVAKPRSGIWRDLHVRHRPTEVDPQITDVVLHAQRLGLQAPIVQQLVGLIREIENGKRAASPDNALELLGALAC
ncbi:ketopantoate reductase family protein [Paracandidimonas soli]|uniref:2-dehydropantoate 2-reductase n=1 Tax=Paracandidimonas soli TaxID=1917182 RepID=A0A4R3VJU0_9BURK|nr:2-dehydropantoate 2-reductase [Paracandidimonas soli]TCV03275.1 ketopantoate reductase [Paracandidimonas soli]